MIAKKMFSTRALSPFNVSTTFYFRSPQFSTIAESHHKQIFYCILTLTEIYSRIIESLLYKIITIHFHDVCRCQICKTSEKFCFQITMPLITGDEMQESLTLLIYAPSVGPWTRKYLVS